VERLAREAGMEVPSARPKSGARPKAGDPPWRAGSGGEWFETMRGNVGRPAMEYFKRRGCARPSTGSWASAPDDRNALLTLKKRGFPMIC
jgi:hypothetical protein